MPQGTLGKVPVLGLTLTAPVTVGFQSSTAAIHQQNPHSDVLGVGAFEKCRAALRTNFLAGLLGCFKESGLNGHPASTLRHPSSFGRFNWGEKCGGLQVAEGSPPRKTTSHRPSPYLFRLRPAPALDNNSLPNLSVQARSQLAGLSETLTFQSDLQSSRIIPQPHDHPGVLSLITWT